MVYRRAAGGRAADTAYIRCTVHAACTRCTRCTASRARLPLRASGRGSGCATLELRSAGPLSSPKQGHRDQIAEKPKHTNHGHHNDKAETSEHHRKAESNGKGVYRSRPLQNLAGRSITVAPARLYTLLGRAHD